MKIVIDGYNIGMPQGTGIKGYGLTLNNALLEMGHETSCLFDRNVDPTKPINRQIEMFASERSATLDADLDWLPSPVGFSIALWRRVVRRLSVMRSACLPAKALALDLSEAATTVFQEGPDGIVYTKRHLWQAALLRERYRGKAFYVEIPDAFDVFHLTAPMPVRVRDVPMVLTIHDTIPFSLPGSTTENLPRLRKRFQSCLDDAVAIATVSENSKQDLISLFDVDPDKIMTTYQPVLVQPMTEPETVDLPQRLRDLSPELEPDGYHVFVGAIEPKKNLARLVRAYLDADVSRPLVIVGRFGWMYDDALAVMKEGGDKVIHLSYLSREALRDVVAGARSMLFPSLYEGFGLPVVEAMVLETPVMTSNTTSLGEVAGDAALTVDPMSVGDMTVAIKQLDRSDDVCRTLRVAGTDRAQEFSVERYKERLSRLYARV